ncbi:hypothetical protein M5U04_07630 [Xenorhabdus sp. XENO-1]|uniref:hypothetical protein n=1 Tax=Xenorhabdus bovienii TaxID=40576 RepID=UPI0020CA38C1|nr:hypothetical protein [Xenorhabdus bovienii]MCP9267969.1 hypothetical protein [Xenorhabdus bovienii subsp. africana]
MSDEKSIIPSNEEMQATFSLSKEMYEKEISHHSTVAREIPELAHLFVKKPNVISSTGYGAGLIEYISGSFNLNTFQQYGSYPFIQISSHSAIIGYAPNVGQRVQFNGYVNSGHTIPILNWNNFYFAGTAHNIRSIINAQLTIQLYINQQNIFIRLFDGNIYLGDLVSVYRPNSIIPVPIVISGVGSFSLI